MNAHDELLDRAKAAVEACQQRFRVDGRGLVGPIDYQMWNLAEILAAPDRASEVGGNGSSTVAPAIPVPASTNCRADNRLDALEKAARALCDAVGMKYTITDSVMAPYRKLKRILDGDLTP